MKKLFLTRSLILTLSLGFISSCACETVPVEQEQKFTISFYVNEEIVHQIDSKGNEVIELPTEPKLDGYIFSGWYFEKEFINKFESNSFENKELTSNINLYAKFNKAEEMIPLKRVINFYVDGNIYHQILTNGNEKLTLPQEPTKENYIFDGWYLDINFSKKLDLIYYESHKIDDNIDVFAKFIKTIDRTPIKKTINFYVDGNIYHQILTNGNEKLVLPTDPSKDGYKFLGWYLDKTFVNEFNLSIYETTTLNDSLNVYANFKLIEYRIKFNTNGGSVVDDFVGIKIDVEPIPTKANHVFDGWYLESNFITKVTFPYMLSKDTTLFAKWIENIPTIKPFEINAQGQIIAYNDTTSKIVKVPESIDGIKVLSIKGMLFSQNNVLTEITLPSTLKNLGYATFKNCKNLKKVVIQGEVTTITSSCFENCTNLESVVMPETIKYINSDSFAYTKLTSFKAPRDLLTIDNQAFIGNKFLTTIDLGSVTNIYRSAFQDCIALTEVALPNSLNDLNQDFVFLNCTNLNKIIMPTKIISIARTLFYGTKYYLDQTNWTNGALYIGSYLVDMNSDFTGSVLNVAPSCKSISNNSILDNITEIVLPEGFEVISKEAFMNKNSLAKVNFPTSLRKIGQNAFAGTKIYENSKNIYKDAIYYNNWLIGVKDVYTQNIENFVLKTGTLGIIDGEFLSFSTRNYMKTLTLNPELLYIGEYAFRATNLTNVEFPMSLKEIGDNAFYLTNINEVKLSKNTKIYSRTFNENTIINRI